jgi:disulfide bond formation protein DsbB
MEDILVKFMATGTILIAVFMLSFFISFIFKSSRVYTKFLKKYGLWIIFLSSLGSMIGSLVLSMGLDLPPCDLCWYQRIFMYPIVFISGFALLKKDYRNGAIYSLLLALVGGVIALYHFLIQWSESLSSRDVVCGLNGGANHVDCSTPYFVEFSFVSIPFMSLTFFGFIIITSFYVYRRN